MADEVAAQFALAGFALAGRGLHVNFPPAERLGVGGYAGIEAETVQQAV